MMVTLPNLARLIAALGVLLLLKLLLNFIDNEVLASTIQTKKTGKQCLPVFIF
ncbi:MAG: hypothetical protein ACJA0G_000920 [Kangiellaceae bacterium]|jgi:hypothetical protein